MQAHHPSAERCPQSYRQPARHPLQPDPAVWQRLSRIPPASHAGVYSLNNIDDQVQQMGEDIERIVDVLNSDADPGELAQVHHRCRFHAVTELN